MNLFRLRSRIQTYVQYEPQRRLIIQNNKQSQLAMCEMHTEREGTYMNNDVCV